MKFDIYIFFFLCQALVTDIKEEMNRLHDEGVILLLGCLSVNVSLKTKALLSSLSINGRHTLLPKIITPTSVNGKSLYINLCPVTKGG